MRTLRYTFLSIAGTAAAVLSSLYFTQAQTASMSIVQTARGEVTVRVLDAHGVPPTELSTDSFRIRIRDAAPIAPQVVIATVDPEATLTVAFVVDASASMKGEPLDNIRRGMAAALPQFASNDRIGMVAASGTINADALDPARGVDFSADRAAVSDTLDALQAAGASPLYDATFKAVRLLSAQPGSPSGTHRAVVVLTDGNQSVPPRSGTFNDDSAVIAANQAGIPIYTFAIGRARDLSYLRRLADLSGGAFATARDSDLLARQIIDTLNRLRTRYTLRFEPGSYTNATNITITLSHQSLSLEASATLAGTATDAAPTAAQSASTATPASPPPQPAAPPPIATGLVNFGGFSLGAPELVTIGGAAAVILIGTIVGLRKTRAPDKAAVRTCRRCGHQTNNTSATTCPVCGAQLS